MMFGGGMPAEKPMTFWPSVRRLLKRLSPERVRLGAVLVLGVASVAFMVIGPKILGRATDLIFAGAIGRQLPASLTNAQVVAAARAAGNNNIADMLARMNVHPGQGIDFGALGDVLMLALGLYVASSVFSWMQGYLLNDVVQTTVFKLRSDVEDKLSRLPLQFFDKQPRGELLSRVTNDIDNVSLS
ncbi:MAG TPA: ABC transporter transmembrane domain-containing protein, partial [Chloroflexota bacterium]